MAPLFHGTTRHRAERTLAQGPAPDFIEPGGGTRAEGFVTCLESGPFPLGTPRRTPAAKRPGSPTRAVLLYSRLTFRTRSSRWPWMRCISR